ncbi:hypothetical protein ACLBT0_28095, partial [Pseudomonas aeruginosa]
MLPQRLHPSRLLALALFSLVLGLAGCQTKPPQQGPDHLRADPGRADHRCP